MFKFNAVTLIQILIAFVPDKYSSNCKNTVYPLLVMHLKIYAPNSFNIVLLCLVSLAWEANVKSSSVGDVKVAPPHSVCSLCPLWRAVETVWLSHASL